MPFMYNNEKRSVNYYGVFTLWSAILVLGSFFVLYTAGCKEIGSLEILIILIIAASVGGLHFLLSFANIAQRLYKKKCIFYTIVTFLLAMCIMLIYGGVRTVTQQCESTLYYERNYEMLMNSTKDRKDSVEKTFSALTSRRNDHYIVSAILDFVAGVLYAASAYAFRHRF